MEVDVRTLLTLLVLISVLRDVCVVPIKLNLTKSRITKSAVLSYKNDSAILLRVKKASVKVGTCSLGKELFKGKCRTQQQIQQILHNDYEDNFTDNETTLYEIVPLRKQRPKAEKEDYVFFTEMDTTTSVVTLPDVPESTDLNVTETTSDTNDVKVNTVSPALVLKGNKTVISRKINNVMYIVLVVCGFAFVLTWLFKLLYDVYLRREDDTALDSCSTEDILTSTSSRTRLYLI